MTSLRFSMKMNRLARFSSLSQLPAGFHYCPLREAQHDLATDLAFFPLFGLDISQATFLSILPTRLPLKGT